MFKYLVALHLLLLLPVALILDFLLWASAIFAPLDNAIGSTNCLALWKHLKSAFTTKS